MPRLIFFPRVGPDEPETVVTGAALTLAPGSTLQPHSSKPLQTVGAAMVLLVGSHQVAMWPDHRGNRAGEECMTTQMPSRCGRPLISILVLGTGSLLSLCPRHKSGELLGGGGFTLGIRLASASLLEVDSAFYRLHGPISPLVRDARLACRLLPRRRNHVRARNAVPCQAWGGLFQQDRGSLADAHEIISRIVVSRVWSQSSRACAFARHLKPRRVSEMK